MHGGWLGCRSRSRLRGRRNHDRLYQRILQRFGVGSLEVFSAGVFGEAGDFPALLCRQAETDHVSGEVDAVLLEFRAERARVGAAGLQTIGDQNDRRFFFRVFQRFGGLLDRGRKRRLAEELHRIGGSGDGACGAGRWRDDELDVLAGAFAMAIGHQAEFHVRRDRLENGFQRLAGDFQLRLAVDLAPHGARSVKHDDCAIGGRGESRHPEDKQRRNEAA